ncbi:hypothetical protein IVB38_14240 [Bradyrhizobium sp. 38]|uniref:hypothetical protein n=1 Tax=unclassified Bradyrhizobium TaxID=2631580 RepID=UPI001FF849A1|nr:MULTISPECIES: hypothetical protein [unclassified Bradyrhizobium]MCK1337156.1 hypothetical protein [Bradyrhizobium sp. 38]MCK1778278.1 hypothetical protein [Bradyrhizobium sp. 132]
MTASDTNQKLNFAKTAIWIVGSLSLAILGSALWDFAFKPLVLWMGEQVAFLTNLGSTALSDAMYREIARGNYERVSLILFQGIVGGIVGLSLGLMTKKRRSGHSIVAQKRPSRPVIYAIIITVLGVLFLQSVRTSYIVRAANHLEQLQTIIAPSLSVEQRVGFRSRMAQIQSKSDYERLVSDLAAAVRDQSAVLPAFDAFK